MSENVLQVVKPNSCSRVSMLNSEKNVNQDVNGEVFYCWLFNTSHIFVILNHAE